MFWIQVASVAGFLAVAMGAFGAHGLKKIRTPEELEPYKTGVLYHLVHVPVLLQIGFYEARVSDHDVDLVGSVFVLGMVLFSGSLYLLTLTKKKKLGAITPIGGVALLVGWVLLAVLLAKAPR